MTLTNHDAVLTVQVINSQVQVVVASAFDVHRNYADFVNRYPDAVTAQDGRFADLTLENPDTIAQWLNFDGAVGAFAVYSDEVPTRSQVNEVLDALPRSYRDQAERRIVEAIRPPYLDDEEAGSLNALYASLSGTD